MDYLEQLITLISDSPVITGAIVVVVGAVWKAAKAWLAAFERLANQKWIDHGEDDDEDMKILRVVDEVKADSIMMSMVPRSVVERQVRKSGGSHPPPPPAKPKPPAN